MCNPKLNNNSKTVKYSFMKNTGFLKNILQNMHQQFKVTGHDGKLQFHEKYSLKFVYQQFKLPKKQETRFINSIISRKKMKVGRPFGFTITNTQNMIYFIDNFME